MSIDWRQLYDLEYPRLLRALTAMGGHREAAEDAAQEAFVRAHRHGLAGIDRPGARLRVRDSADRVVASGYTTASIGTSAVWGTFQTTVTVPPSTSGAVKLEVFWGSPRDGSDMGLVGIPLRIR